MNRLKITMRAVSQRVTWYLGTRFPDTFALVFVTGYPKSGTTWVSQLVADALQIPYPRHALLPIGFEAVVHGHRLANSRYRRGVYVMRDGRDALVSFYFHLARQLPAAGREAFSREQRRLFPNAADSARICDNLPAFIEAQMTRPTAAPAHWGAHVESFLNGRHPGLPGVRYEDLLTDPDAALSAVIESLTGRVPTPQSIRRTLDKFSFARQTSRLPGDEQRSAFLRKGTAGDWREHFNRESAEVFHHYCGQTLVRAGYEQDSQWVSGCMR